MPRDVNGILVVDKPVGVTSRRVVDHVARALGTRAVGHAGTLDPLARGVVVVGVGRGTRLVEFVQELPKTYRGTFRLGCSSPSDDLETPVEHEAAPVVPERSAVESALVGFRGEFLQRPCDYSAVHVAGQRAYRLARKGRALDLTPRRVRIDRLDLVEYQWPRLELDLVCSAGTFVRALGRDLACSLGTRAVMEALTRTAVGPFTLEGGLAMDALTPATAAAALQPALAAVAHLPRVTLDEETAARLVRGGLFGPATSDQATDPLDDPDVPAGAAAVAAVDAGGGLLGVLRVLPTGWYRLRPNLAAQADPSRADP